MGYVRLENRLTGQQVKDMMEMYRDKDIEVAEIARTFGLAQSTVSRYARNHGLRRRNSTVRGKRHHKMSASEWKAGAGAALNGGDLRDIRTIPDAKPSPRFTVLVLDASAHIVFAEEGTAREMIARMLEKI